MDKLQKHLPIRKRHIKQPVIFTFNIILNQFLSYKTTHYLPVQNVFTRGSNIDSFHLLPNVSNVSMTIEERGA
jgi:hypothetical protein